MAWSFDVNGTIPASGAEIFFRLKTMLKSLGWTVPMSSDGTTYNPSGDQLVNALSGAGGFNNSQAWFVIQCPGHTRQYCFQRATGSSDASWRIKYSPAGFTGGSPSATVTPTGTNEQILYGTGTDTAPSFTSIIDSPTLNRINIIAGGVNEGYSFLLMFFKFGQNGVGNYMMMDALQPGSYHPFDTDPVIICSGSLNTISNFSNELISLGGNCRSWYRLGYSDATWQAVAAIHSAYNTNTSALNLLNGFPYATTSDSLSYVTWARPINNAPPAGVKGLSTMLRWVGRMRNFGTVLSVGEPQARNWVQVGGSSEACFFTVPWNGTRGLLTK